jgi:hypothetical protein
VLLFWQSFRLIFKDVKLRSVEESLCTNYSRWDSKTWFSDFYDFKALFNNSPHCIEIVKIRKSCFWKLLPVYAQAWDTCVQSWAQFCLFMPRRSAREPIYWMYVFWTFQGDFRVSEANKKTRVIREFSWAISRGGVLIHHLGTHFQIEFLGHRQKFRQRVELEIEANSCNLFGEFLL